MSDTKLDSPEAIKAFLGGTDKLDFQVSKTTRYSFLAGTLKRTNYFKLSKKDKGPVLEYMEKMSGYSWPQLKRLIAQYREKRWIGRKVSNRHTFMKRYIYCARAQSEVLVLLFSAWCAF